MNIQVASCSVGETILPGENKVAGFILYWIYSMSSGTDNGLGD